MSISAVRSNPSNAQTNPTNAVQLNQIKAQLEAKRLAQPVRTPGTDTQAQVVNMPGSASEGRKAGSLLSAYA